MRAGLPWSTAMKLKLYYAAALVALVTVGAIHIPTHFAPPAPAQTAQIK